jgi:molybdopterin-guanine dinucleotide biosynthesis protein A
LTGGKSSRLGRIKATEKIGAQTLLELVIESLFPITRSILVVFSESTFDLVDVGRFDVKVVVDLYREGGVLGGLYTGLVNAGTRYSLAVGCDMPFLNAALLRYLVDLAPGFDIVVPRCGRMYEPLHAVYSRRCLPFIAELIEQNKLKVSNLFDLVNTRYVEDKEIAKYDPRHLSFFNINTLHDLELARKLTEGRSVVAEEQVGR